MLFNKKNRGENSFWMSYTDLMSGFLVIFIILSLIAYKGYRQEARLADKLASELSDSMRVLDSVRLANVLIDSLLQSNNVRLKDIEGILATLQQNDLKNMLEEYKSCIRTDDPRIEVSFDDERGSIVLRHRYPGELFSSNAHKQSYNHVTGDLALFLKGDGKNPGTGRLIVARTMDLCKKYKTRRFELRIEGHTDPTWEYGYQNGFIENLKLSSERANSVYEYILNNCGLSDLEVRFVQKNMISVGYSYSSRIDGETGMIERPNDKDLNDKSRRIEFRIIAY